MASGEGYSHMRLRPFLVAWAAVLLCCAGDVHAQAIAGRLAGNTTTDAPVLSGATPWPPSGWSTFRPSTSALATARPLAPSVTDTPLGISSDDSDSDNDDNSIDSPPVIVLLVFVGVCQCSLCFGALAWWRRRSLRKQEQIARHEYLRGGSGVTDLVADEDDEASLSIVAGTPLSGARATPQGQPLGTRGDATRLTYAKLDQLIVRIESRLGLDPSTPKTQENHSTTTSDVNKLPLPGGGGKGSKTPMRGPSGLAQTLSLTGGGATHRTSNSAGESAELTSPLSKDQVEGWLKSDLPNFNPEAAKAKKDAAAKEAAKEAAEPEDTLYEPPQRASDSPRLGGTSPSLSMFPGRADSIPGPAFLVRNSAADLTRHSPMRRVSGVGRGTKASIAVPEAMSPRIRHKRASIVPPPEVAETEPEGIAGTAI